MSDALSALDQLNDYISKLASTVSVRRAKSITPPSVQPIARQIARTYFERLRPELQIVQSRAGLTEEIDFVIQAILELATTTREKHAYLGQITELRPHLLEATVDVMKARGSPRLVLSQTERAILETLTRMLPGTAASYEQALRDIAQAGRVSWRGTASELREVLREVIDHLAPDENVVAAPGFQPEQGQRSPTQKQKVRFILRARRSTTAAITVVETSLATVEEVVAALARSTYQRGSVSTHTTTSASEIRSLKRYVDALLGELLEIA